MFAKILVPTDGSPLSDMVIGRAIDFAQEQKSHLTFFCATPSSPAIYCGFGGNFDEQAPVRFRELAHQTAQELLNIAKSRAHDAGVECDSLVLFSTAPYEAIIEAAERKGCDLIFMASHGRRGIDALLLGSETRKVLTHSKIPVLVYR